MPVPPRPYTVRCLDCGWKKTYAPASDVLRPEDLPPALCPLCRSPKLQSESKSDLVGSITQTLKRILGDG